MYGKESIEIFVLKGSSLQDNICSDSLFEKRDKFQ